MQPANCFARIPVRPNSPLNLNVTDLLMSASIPSFRTIVTSLGYTHCSMGIFHTLNSMIPRQLELTVAALHHQANDH